jgi:hypothetical protein
MPTAEGTGLLAKGAKLEPVLVETGNRARAADFGEKKRRKSKSA